MKKGVVYKDDPGSKAKELEEYLFGSRQDARVMFDAVDDDEEDSVADMLRKVRVSCLGLAATPC